MFRRTKAFMKSAQVVTELTAIVGSENVLTQSADRDPFERDWTGRYLGATPAVVLPGSTEEVSTVLAFCNQHLVSVVPQGGNTGQVGGSVPLNGEIVLSLRRLKRIDSVNSDVPSVVVGAGVTLDEVLKIADQHGLTFGVDLSPKEAATVGGMIATNAGGLRFLRYGSMRNQLLGIEAVLADGTVISHLRGLPKDNSGYDLPSLFCGSEGTLGVITAASIKLVPQQPLHAVARVGLESFNDALATVRLLRATGMLESAEVILPAGVDLVAEFLQETPPFNRAELYLIVELAGVSEVTKTLEKELQAQQKQFVLASDSKGREKLWRWLKNHSNAISWHCHREGYSAPQKYDVSIPLKNTVPFLHAIEEACSGLGTAKVIVFGHIGDGNLHINVLGTFDQSFSNRIDEAVLQTAIDYGGSISAEHGIGTSKSRYLPRYRTPQELRLFDTLKCALDPNRILNPHVLRVNGHQAKR